MFNVSSNHQSISIKFLILLSILFPAIAFAGGKGYGGSYFKSLRNDLTVPEKCREVDLTHFSTYNLETFYYGPVGANDRGFTHEYPVRRDDARKLWAMAKDLVHGGHEEDVEKQARGNQQVLRDFHIIAGHFRDMGFDFESEGEVLEILAILDMASQLTDDYYVYGSVFYNDRVAGELDLMVGRRADCQIISIGEAKLGLKSLSKAHEQLERFKNFLRTHLHKALNPFALEQYSR